MRALILVDIQNDFLPGGALAVRGGDEVVPVANRLLRPRGFDFVIATQDWHPRDHGSFASNHPGKRPGDHVLLSGVDQVLWPDHCVQGTRGAELAPGLDRSPIDVVFQKGTDPSIDSYSAFYDNGHAKATGLGDFLATWYVSDVYVMGLATDYCVKFTVLDALALELRTHLVVDGCRGVNLAATDSEEAIREMELAGAILVRSGELVAPMRAAA